MVTVDPFFKKLGHPHAVECYPSIQWDHPQWVQSNPLLADTLGLPSPVTNSPALCWWQRVMDLVDTPTASVYAGHQFGQFAGQLGDGRALTLGVSTTSPGIEIQVKGAGRTPFSRFGDGRAVLRSSIREYLASVAMDALGIPTTGALALMTTGERVIREAIEPGALLVRTAPCFIRFGHFEHHFAMQDIDTLRALADTTIEIHWPHLQHRDDRHLVWFSDVVNRTARLIAYWQSIGFCHGVMNTDNMSILGLTLDYGPFGMMEAYNPHHICNHSDQEGRYAYRQQPSVAHWNCWVLATVLTPILTDWAAVSTLLDQFWTTYTSTFDQLVATKLGLPHPIPVVAYDLFDLMATHQMDFTQTFRRLADTHHDPGQWLSLANYHPDVSDWLTHFHHLLNTLAVDPQAWATTVNAQNPKYILRNWVAEWAIRAAEDHHDMGPITHLSTILSRPFDDWPEWDHLAQPAPDAYLGLNVSCSS